MPPSPKLEAAALSEAVDRFMRRRLDPSTGARSNDDLDIWLAADPAHRAAFDRLGDHWSALDELRAEPAVLLMIDEARRDYRRMQWRRLGRWTAGVSAAAAVAVGLVMIPTAYDAVGALRARAHAEVYKTGVGQMANIRLPDGTLATLDTDTVIRSWQEPRARLVVLEHGRARFHVAKDSSRPFSVLAAGKSVTAVGTDFDVDLRPNSLRVSLVEGRLRVKGEGLGRKAASLDMSAGYRFEASGSNWNLEKTNALWDVAWTQQQLIFEESTLRDIAHELNRYSDRKIVINDPDVARLRMSAQVQTTDTRSFLSAVERMSLARVRSVDGGYELVRFRPEAK